MEKIDNEENKSVTIIVRETPWVKSLIIKQSKDNGYDNYSDYVRSLWEHLWR